MTSFRMLTVFRRGLLCTLLGFAAFSQAQSLPSRPAKLPATVSPSAPDLVVSTSVPALKSQMLAARAVSEKKAIRARATSIDLSALQSVRSKLNVAADKPLLRIAFFTDAVLTIEVSRAEATSSGGIAYIGTVSGDPQSIAILVNNNGVVSINVSSQARKYALHGSDETGFIASELSPVDRPDHPPGSRYLTDMTHVVNEKNGGLASLATSASPVTSATKAADDPVPNPAPQADDGSTMDVMVLYTPAARLSQTPGTTAQMNANIDAQIALTNTVYANSLVVQRLRLVYKGEVNYTEVNMDTDLDRLLASNDGYLDEAPILRDIYGADFVSLWGVYTDYCGLGSLMTNEQSTGNAARAYNTVASPACTSGNAYTFAHELGHNMGLRHDNYVDPSSTNSVTAEGTGTVTTIGYAHGYIDLTNRFRTVMSYNDQCAATFGTGAPTFGCVRIPYFSNPSISYNNNAIYAPAVSATTGNATTANERQALNDTRETTANFRASIPSLTGPGVLVYLPKTLRVAESAGTASLRVERHAGSTGAVSVAYATSNGTATAGQDFTTTTGTLTWADGETGAKFITVPILQDSTLEGTESFTVTMNNPTGGASVGIQGGTSSAAVVSIVDDEPDTFPMGGIVPAIFSTPASSPGAWQVEPNDGYLSPTSLRSAQTIGGAGNTYVNSDLEYTGTFSGANLTFAYRVSSYSASYGVLDFMIDNTSVPGFAVGGESGWLTANIPVSAGPHTLRWRFTNRLSFACANAIPAAPGGSNCADRGYVDSIVLPLTGATLNVIRSGTGNGTVTGTGINCGVDCIEVYNLGTSVTLTAVANVDSTFTGWSGGGCTGTGTCTTTMNAAQSVTAQFTLLPEVFPANCTVPANFTTPGTATGSWAVATDRKHSGTCSLKSSVISDNGKAQIQTTGNFSAGTVSFYFNVSSEAGYDCLKFYIDTLSRSEIGTCSAALGSGATGEIGWTQVSIPVSAGTHTFLWSYEKDVTLSAGSDAAWIDDVSLPALAPVTLTVAKAGTGSGTVTGTGINCGVDCTEDVPGGTVVTLTATPQGGSTFAGWSNGGCAGTGNCVVTVNAATTVTATFNANATAPGAPVIGAATPGNTVATVDFSPPASTGGSPISGYTLTCNAGGFTASGGASPLTVTGLTNGVLYNCSVTATNAVGTGPASGTVPVTPSAGASLALISVVSRKMHAGIPYDLPIVMGLPIGGSVSVEPRNMGSAHSIVFQFNNTVTSTGTASVTGAATGTPTLTFSGNEVVVTLPGVADLQRVGITLTNVNGSYTTPQVNMGFMIGDITGNRAINASDISFAKAQVNKPLSQTNFMADLDATGTISQNEVNAVKARSGKVLP